MLYDVLGGIRAVIWSDVLQMAILVSVLGYLLWSLTGDAGGLDAMLKCLKRDSLRWIFLITVWVTVTTSPSGPC